MKRYSVLSLLTLGSAAVLALSTASQPTWGSTPNSSPTKSPVAPTPVSSPSATPRSSPVSAPAPTTAAPSPSSPSAPPLDRQPNPPTEAVDPASLDSRKRYARQITVEISSPSVWGTGVILQRSFQGNQYHYLVLTNDHVMRSATTANLKTADGQSHQGEVVQWPSLEGYDLALLKFTAPHLYSVATFAPLGSVQPWQPVYVAGFPIEPQSQSRPAFDLVEGEVILVAEHALEWGYQIGYHNDTAKGMSGGPVLNQNNEVVAIHGLGAFPFWGNPYTYKDGSPPPCESLWQVMYRLSWGIPVETIAAVVPPVLTIASPARFDPLSGTVAQTSASQFPTANAARPGYPSQSGTAVAPTLASFPGLTQSQALADTQSWLSQNSAVYEAGLQAVPPWNHEPSWEDLETQALVTLAQACLPLPASIRAR